ncbi:MAG: hypothetical protein IJ190_01240 [Prevotella sp.]|nr:hypothetical protein [Prevotella sp.]
MEEAKDLAMKMVELTDSQAEMAVYKHLNDHLEKYAQKLHRELNETNQKLTKMDKKGVKSNDYSSLYVNSNLLKCQIYHVEKLKLEFLRRTMEVCDSCDNPLKEAQELYKRLVKA